MKKGIYSIYYKAMPLIDSIFCYLKNPKYQKSSLVLALFIAFFNISSCSDSGCVEADDFGEYQTKTIVVKASESIDSCTYDLSSRENLSSDSHGSGLTACFTTSNVTLYDSSGTSYTSSSGCDYWQPLIYASDGTTTTNPSADLPVMNLCVTECTNQCNTRVMSGSTNPEPSWASTDKDQAGGGEVTIAAGTEVSVRATGSVTLGGEQDLTVLHVHANESSFLPSSKNASGQEIYQKISSGDVVNLKFSGGFNDRDLLLGSSTSSVGNVGLTTLADQSSLESYFLTNPDKRADLINATRRLVMYMEEFRNGYSYDSSGGAVYSDANVRGVPNNSYHEAWDCTYTGTSNIFQTVCRNDIASYRSRYTNLGTLAEATAAINSKYPISSSSRSGLDVSIDGGILKIDSDHRQFQDESGYDPFPTAQCANGYDCTGVSSLSGSIVGDLSSNQVKPIGRNSQIYFKYLQSGCSGNINVKIKSSVTSPNDLYVHNGLTVGNSWTSGGVHVSGQSNQFIEIERVGGTATFSHASSASALDCGRSLAIKFVPYYDFTVAKSGLVSFANIANSTGTSSNCNIKFRIINPTGSHSSYNLSTTLINAYNLSGGGLSSIDADFYEYGDFNTSNMPEDASDLRVVSTSWNSNLRGKIFVRKGQKIRFSPESWTGTWTPNSLQRQCGVGMGVRIEHRPAFLCRGQGTVNVANPTCSQKFVSGNVRGCQATSLTCSDSASGSLTFCPSVDDCIGDISFTEPTDSVSPRTNGTVTRMSYPTSGTDMQNHGCDYVYSITSVASSSSAAASSSTRTALDNSKVDKCNACQDDMKTAGEQSPVISQNGISHCYNLENYSGSVENITSAYNNFFSTVPAPSTRHDLVTKGMIKLQRFDGISGHVGDHSDGILSSFVPSGKSHFFSRSGRLSLMILDGKDFKPTSLASSYSNNGVSSGSVSYSTSSHNNGFRVKLTSFLEFGNGENLEVLFCRESSNSSTLCRSINRRSETATNITNVPKLIDKTSTNNSFSFDNHGNLYRTTGPRSGKKNCDGVSVNDKYFCHCRGDFSAADAPAGCTGASSDADSSSCTSVDNCLYRLTFKILDPENTNCGIPTSSTDLTSTAYDDRISYACSNSTSPAVSIFSMPKCNGIKVANNDYVDVPSSNTGAICSYTDLNPLPGVSGCKKQYKCVSKYVNNTGRYNVLVRVKNKNTTVSGLVSAVIDPVLRVMDGYTKSSGVRVPGQAERIYKLIIADPVYKLLLKLSLILMISFYGLTFLMGLNEGGTSDIISRMVKIGLIFFFVSDDGWYWFHSFVVGIFKYGTDELTFLMATSFDNSPALRAAVDNGDYTDKSILFSGIDKVMGLFFSSAVQKKISALLFSGLFGWFYILIIYHAFIAYVFAAATAVLIFLTAQVFISILFVLGPIFFIFTLFDKTKEMFDKWLQQLIGFSLQQIFLLVTLSFFNMMMHEIIKNSLGYKVCWDEVWTINIIIRISLMSFWTIPNIPPLFDSQAEMGSSGRGEGVPSFFSILFIWMVAKLMKSMISFMSDVAADIGGGMKASGLAGGISNSVAQVGKVVSKGASKVYDKSIGYGVQRVDQKLFNSGRLADKVRKDQRKQDSHDLKNKNAMTKSGRNAVNEFKKKHGAELAGKSKEEQQAKLNEVRNQGMIEKGKKLGLGDDEIKRLQNDRGTKYRGDNLAGLAMKRIYQKTQRGGSVSRSITKRDVKTDLTKKQAKSSLKNADEKGRKDMIDAVKKGELFVRSGSFSHRQSDRIKGPQILESKKHANARKELEDEGKINKISGIGPLSGFGMFNNRYRSDEDKKAIRERVKSNKFAEDKGNINKRSRVSTVASLEMEKDYLDAEQDKGKEDRGDYIRKSALNKITGGRLGGEARVKGKFKAFREKKDALKSGRLESMRDELLEKKDELSGSDGNSGVLAEQTGIIANLNDQMNDIKRQDPNVARHEELSVQAQASSSSADKKIIRKEMKKIRESSGKKTQAGIDLLEDKKSEKNKAENIRTNAIKSLGEIPNKLEQVEDMINLEKGIEHVLKDGEKGSSVVKAANMAKKDLDKFKEGVIGVEGGTNKAGVIAAVARVATIAPAVRGAIYGSGVKKGGIIGTRNKGTKESMEYMSNKHKIIADIGKSLPPKDDSSRGDVARPDAGVAAVDIGPSSGGGDDTPPSGDDTPPSGDGDASSGDKKPPVPPRPDTNFPVDGVGSPPRPPAPPVPPRPDTNFPVDGVGSPPRPPVPTAPPVPPRPPVPTAPPAPPVPPRPPVPTAPPVPPRDFSGDIET